MRDRFPRDKIVDSDARWKFGVNFLVVLRPIKIDESQLVASCCQPISRCGAARSRNHLLLDCKPPVSSADEMSIRARARARDEVSLRFRLVPTRRPLATRQIETAGLRGMN